MKKNFALIYGLIPFFVSINSFGLIRLNDGTWQTECRYRDFYTLDVRCIDEEGSYCIVGNTFDLAGDLLDIRDLNPTELLLMYEVNGENRCYDLENEDHIVS